MIDKRYGNDEIEEVKKLAKRIGYGTVMILCEMLWYDEIDGDGSNFSVGCCTAFLVDCPCDNAVECDWCVGSRRVTKKVAEAMAKEPTIEAYKQQIYCLEETVERLQKRLKQ